MEPLDLITKDVYELRKIIRDKKKIFQKEKDKEAEREHEAEQKRLREKDRHEKEKDHEKDRERKEKNKEPQRQREDHMEKVVVLEDRNHLRQEENGHSVGMHFLHKIRCLVISSSSMSKLELFILYNFLRKNVYLFY